MSVPYGQQQPQLSQPPPYVSNQQAYTNHAGSSSVGPVIAVLTVIAVLGVMSAMIGRLCSGKKVPGLGPYDFEGWFERKFGPCINGRTGTLPTRMPRVNAMGAGDVPVVIPVEVPKQSATISSSEEPAEQESS